MELLLAIIVLLVVSFIPVALAGPVAALLFVSAAKKKKLSAFYLFWLVIINVLLFMFIGGMHGSTMFGPGDVAICGIPLSIVATVSILNASKNDVTQFINDDLQQQKYYAIGRILLPVSQAVIIFIACGLISIFDP